MYKIRCVSKGVPEDLQWVYGWIYEFRNQTFYTCGGITKDELIRQLDQRTWNYYMQWA